VCEGKKNDFCPPGAKHKKEFVNLPAGVFLEEDDDMIPKTKKIFKKIPKTKKSILEPAQFLAITRPGCEENKLYYACAANAYVTSIEHDKLAMPMGAMMGGMGGGYGGNPYEMGPSINTKAHSACQPTPPECNDPKAWSGEK
jgi:hypothetical protein